MKDDELFKLSTILTVEDFSKLLRFWFKDRALSLKFEESQDILRQAMEAVTTANEVAIRIHSNHAMEAECAGSEALMKCKNLELLERAEKHVAKFKDRSYCNYKVWFYEHLNKLKK